jgi:hypothetical protein
MKNKMDEFLALYDNSLITAGVPRIEQRFETPTSERRLAHLRHLIDDLRHGPGSKGGEANRLIQFGLIQGGLWAENIFTAVTLADHRRNLLEGVSSTQ